MFLSWQNTLINSTTAKTLFLYDPATNTDLVTNTVVGAMRAGTTVDETVLIDGHPTIKLASATQGVLVTFPTPLDLGNMLEWTIEWSSFPTAIGTNYFTDLYLNWTGGPYIGARWTDAGFGHRLQFSASGFSNLSSIWRIPTTKAQAVNKLAKYAMVFKDGKVSVFKDGVKQTMNNGTTNNISSDYMTKDVVWQPLTTLNLGWMNSTNSAFTGNSGRIRISQGARYLTNYTPEPF